MSPTKSFEANEINIIVGALTVALALVAIVVAILQYLLGMRRSNRAESQPRNTNEDIGLHERALSAPTKRSRGAVAVRLRVNDYFSCQRR